MFGLALRSLRYRTSGFAASFISLFLGAYILMTFASMLDTGFAPGLDDDSSATLVTVSGVVGGWGLIIVAFAVGSTLTLLVRQRSSEMALLRSIGATPAQTTWMVVGEGAMVAILAGTLAITPALFSGELLLNLLIDTGQVAEGVGYVFGTMALSVGLSITFAAAVIAAVVASRRTAGVTARQAMMTVTDNPKMSKKRIFFGILFLLAGVNCGVLIATVLKDWGIEGMAVAGQAMILSSIGFAILSPALAKAAIALVGGPLRWLTGVSGYLTVLNVRQRTRQFADGLIAIILFTGIATGTLYLQAIENSAIAATGVAKTAEYKNIETLNFVVVGMIALFAAVMLINTLVAAVIHRRNEFGQQRLTGATPPQVLGMVSVEGVLLSLIGILFGSVAAVVAIVPYSLAKTDSAMPNESILIYLGIVAIAAFLTLVTSLGAARRAIRMPAIRAITV